GLPTAAEKTDPAAPHFFHAARRRLTVLKGVPGMRAVKEDNDIAAAELRIQDVTPPPGTPSAKPYQKITALGPGEIHLLDKATGKKTTHAYWDEALTSTKDGADGRLVLTAAARFYDRQTDQT